MVCMPAALMMTCTLHTHTHAPPGPIRGIACGSPVPAEALPNRPYSDRHQYNTKRSLDNWRSAGLPAGTDPAVIALVRERGVAIEICPSSNVHTGSISSVANHPVLRMLHEGLTVVPCCDNSLLSQTSTMDEYNKLRDDAGVSDDQLVAVRQAAHTAAFPVGYPTTV